MNNFSLQGVRQYTIKDYSMFKTLPNNLLLDDLVRNCPVFVFVYDENIAKEYLYNIFAFLKKNSYPVYWYGQEILPEHTSRQVLLASPEAKLTDGKKASITFYPGQQGRKAIWNQIKKYVEPFVNLNTVSQSVEKPSFVFIDNPKEYKWLYNLAGFFDYNGITYSWNKSDISENSCVLGFATDDNQKLVEGKVSILIPNEYKIEIEQKKYVFSMLLKENFIQKCNGQLGKFELGTRLK